MLPFVCCIMEAVTKCWMKIITCLPGKWKGLHLYCTLTANTWYFSLRSQEIESVVRSLHMIYAHLLPCFNMGHTQIVLQMRKTRSGLTPSTKSYIALTVVWLMKINSPGSPSAIHYPAATCPWNELSRGFHLASHQLVSLHSDLLPCDCF